MIITYKSLLAQVIDFIFKLLIILKLFIYLIIKFNYQELKIKNYLNYRKY